MKTTRNDFRDLANDFIGQVGSRHHESKRWMTSLQMKLERAISKHDRGKTPAISSTPGNYSSPPPLPPPSTGAASVLSTSSFSSEPPAPPISGLTLRALREKDRALAELTAARDAATAKAAGLAATLAQCRKMEADELEQCRKQHSSEAADLAHSREREAELVRLLDAVRRKSDSAEWQREQCRRHRDTVLLQKEGELERLASANRTKLENLEEQVERWQSAHGELEVLSASRREQMERLRSEQVAIQRDFENNKTVGVE